ncbi:MAG: lipase family protein [Bacteroidia bacterium]
MKHLTCLLLTFFILTSCSNNKTSTVNHTAAEDLEDDIATTIDLQSPYMPIEFNSPSSENIAKSLSRLGSGSLMDQDIFNIIWQFTISPVAQQNQLLRDIYPENKKLAETLIIYRNRLSQADSLTEYRPQMIDKVFMHYVVNTDGIVPVREDSTPLEILDITRNYSRSLGFSITDTVMNGDMPALNLAERTEPCMDCKGADYLALRSAGIEINKMRYGRPDVIPSTAFSFNSKDTAYAPENAMILADFSNLAYFEKPFVKEQLKLWNYKLLNWFEDKGSDTQGFVACKDDYLVICFRGTSSITDAGVDAWISKTTAYGGIGKVHRGFQNALESVWSQVIKKVDKNTKVFVTGHSLGAALATLAAHRLSLEKYSVAGVYTYGSPRVGNSEFKKSYDELLKSKTFLHINNTDIVPTVPPEILGFVHPGTVRMFNKDHKITLNVSDGSTTHNIEEKEFDELNAEQKIKIENKIKQADKSIKATTNFMTASPNRLEVFSYTAKFEDGKVDDHGVDQYLFKLACAIVDREWQHISKNKN